MVDLQSTSAISVEELEELLKWEAKLLTPQTDIAPEKNKIEKLTSRLTNAKPISSGIKKQKRSKAEKSNDKIKCKKIKASNESTSSAPTSSKKEEEEELWWDASVDLWANFEKEAIQGFKKKQEEEETLKKKQEEETLKKKLEEETIKKKQKEEEKETLKKKQEEEETLKKKQEEEETLKKKQEEEEEEEEEETLKKKQEDEALKNINYRKNLEERWSWAVVQLIKEKLENHKCLPHHCECPKLIDWLKKVIDRKF